MRVMGEAPVHMDKPARDNQFIGIRYVATVDLKNGCGLKTIRFFIQDNPGFHLQYFLNQ